MTIKEFDEETEKILDERVVERRKLEREKINANIAARDAKRVEKQRLEDEGLLIRPLYYPPEPEPEPAPVEEKKSVIKKVKEAIIKPKEPEPVEITTEEILEEEIIPDEVIEEALTEDYKPEDKIEGEESTVKPGQIPPPSEEVIPPLPTEEETIEEILEEELIPEEVIEDAMSMKLTDEEYNEAVAEAKEKIKDEFEGEATGEPIVDPLLEKDEILTEQKDLSKTLGEAKKDLNDNIEQLEKIDQDWIDEYKNETGRNAIWRGEITKGFKDFCREVLGKEL